MHDLGILTSVSQGEYEWAHRFIDPHGLGPLIEKALRYTEAERVWDPTSGTGVVQAVCDEANIPCVSGDLHDPDKPRDLFDMVDKGGFDLVVIHPDLWRARPGGDHIHDTGRSMTWDAYVELVRDMVAYAATTLRAAGHIMLICPIARYKGKTHQLSHDIRNLLGVPREPPIINLHPGGTRSRGTLYGKRFVPIEHDEVLLYTKMEVLR